MNNHTLTDVAPERVRIVQAGLAHRFREHVGDGSWPPAVVLWNPHW